MKQEGFYKRKFSLQKQNNVIMEDIHAGNYLSAKEMLAKYPNDTELAMKEYAKQFVVISYQKSLVATGCQPNPTARDEQFLVTDKFLSEHENEWVFVEKASIMNVINLIK